MLKIRLCCVTGMLSNVLLNKIVDAAKLKQLDIDIKSIAESHVEYELQNETIDVILVGPHMSYKLQKIQTICDSYNVASGMISMHDYGFMNGDNILTMAISLINDMKDKLKITEINNEIHIEEKDISIESSFSSIESINSYYDESNNSYESIDYADPVKSYDSEKYSNSDESINIKDSNTMDSCFTKPNLYTLDNSSEIISDKTEKCTSNSALSDIINNFEGNDIMINKIKELLSNAEKDIYINTNMDIGEFQEEFIEASQKGVRITVVACDKYKEDDLQIDKLYTFSNERNRNILPKFMLVVDNKIALVSEQNKNSNDIFFTVTDDSILISVISKNIDNYIYILKLRDNIDFKLRDN